MSVLKKLVVFQLHVGVMRNSEDTVALDMGTLNMVRIWVHFLKNWWIETIQDGTC